MAAESVPFPDPSAAEVVPSYTLSVAAQAEVAGRAFADYLVSLPALGPDGFARLIASQGLDLALSRHLTGPAGPLGFGYLNRTAGIARLASMGLVPEARHRGLGGRLLARLLDESRARGDAAMTLEVFEQNLPALALYRRHGFREVTRLHGWRLSGPVSVSTVPDDPGVREASLVEAARWPGEPDYPDLPWQVSRHAVARAPAGARAYASGQACVVTTDPATNPVRVLALFPGTPDGEGWSALRRLLAAVLRRFPDASWFIPQVHPEPTDREVFGPLGFTREPLNQILMIREFR